MKLFQRKKEKSFKFIPQKDITAYEIANLVQVFGLHTDEYSYEHLTPELKRHFSEVTSTSV